MVWYGTVTVGVAVPKLGQLPPHSTKALIISAHAALDQSGERSEAVCSLCAAVDS